MIAGLSLRLGVSPREIRESAWVDVREILKQAGASVPKTEAEFHAVIEEMKRHG